MKKSNPVKIVLDFDKMSDKELLHHFIKSSGWGYSGKQNNGQFTIKGPEWEEEWNPISRENIIEELKERKRIDEEENDYYWFSYLNENVN